jgi:FtsH-binding integral membrane protein
MPLLLALVDLFVVLALMICWAYCWNVEEVYIMSHRILAIVVLGFPLLLFLLLWSDIAPKRTSSGGVQPFNGGHALSFGLTAVMLVGFTTISIMDARK